MSIASIIGIIAATWWITAVLTRAGAVAGTFLHPALRRRAARRADRPGVSVVIPVAASGPDMEAAFVSIFRQAYPRFEVLITSADEDSPALEVARDVAGRFPDVPVRFLLGNEPFTLNPKISNVAPAVAAASNDLVLIKDANVTLADGQLVELVANLTPGTGMVCAVPIGVGPEGFWAEVECATMNAHAAPWLMGGAVVRQNIGYGKVMLFRREDFHRVHGVEVMGATFGDDQALAKAFAHAGLRTVFSAGVIRQVIGRRTLREVWDRQLRWMVIRRDEYPFVFLGEPFGTALWASVAGGIGGATLGLSGWVVALATLALWLAADTLVVVGRGWGWSWRFPAAAICRDLLIAGLWVRGWWTREVSWAGQGFEVNGKPPSTLAKLRFLIPGGFLDADIRRVLRHYWRAVGVRPWHVVIPLILTLVEVTFEGASFSLLIPLTQAFSHNSFSFLDTSKAFGWIVALVPAPLLASPRRDAYVALTILLLALVARVGRMVAKSGASFYLNWRDTRLTTRVQAVTFERILGFGRQYFDRRPLGHLEMEVLWSRATINILGAVDALLRDILSIVAKVAVMVALSAPLTLTIAVIFPAIVAAMGRISKVVERQAHARADLERNAKSQALELLATVPLVRAFSQEKEAAASYEQCLDDVNEVTRRRRNLMAIRWPIEELLVLSTVVVAQGVLMLTARSFVPGDLARLGAFLLLVQQVMPNLKCFGTFGMALASERPALRYLVAHLDDADKFIVAGGSRTFRGLRKGIAIRDLSFAYADAPPTLKGISVFIPAHSLTAVVGGSGAGKTTFAHLLARFYDCPPGTILLDGVDIREFALPSLYSRLAIVSQDVWLLNRTLRENLVYGLEDPPDDDQLLQLLAEVKLEDLGGKHGDPLDVVLGDRGIQLSGGQRQRVALARALLREPDILILDEATAALDSIVERTVTEAIARRSGDRTMLVIAHRLSTVRGADRVLVFKDGRVVEEGSWDELLGLGGEFARLHQAQFEEATV